MIISCLQPGLLTEVCVGTIASVCAFTSGVCRGFPVFLIPQLKLEESFISLTEDAVSWLGSLSMFVVPAGCILGGVIIEILGRKKYFVSMYVPYICGWITISFATNLLMLYFGLAVIGFVAGMGFCVSSYLGEICSSKTRGTIISLVEPAYASGITFCNLCLYYLGWRKSAQYFIPLTIASMCCQFLMPESPNWLVRKGRNKEAREILSQIRPSQIEVNKEILELEECYIKCKKQKTNTMESVRNVLLAWRQFFTVLGVLVLQQMCGFPIFLSYTVVFFEKLNLPVDNNYAALIFSVTCFLSSFLAPFSVSYMNRRTSLGLSGFAAGITLIPVAIYETVYLDSIEKPYYWIVPIFIYIYIVCVSLGIVPVAYILAGELFPSQIAGLMSGVYGCVGYLIVAAVLKVAPHFLSTFGITTSLWILSISSLFHVPFAIYVLPETSGKSVNEIQNQYFTKSRTVKVSKTIDTPL